MTTAFRAPASTADPAASSVRKKIFSFPVAIASLLTVLAVLTMRSRFDDPDMWWHLKTGEVISTSHRIPRADTFSYTALHQPSIPHEWLSQLSIFAAYHLGGYSGLMLWLCFFTAAILIAGYALCALYSGDAKVGFVGAFAIWFFGTIGFAIRPQMIGYLLLIVELLLLQLGRTRNPRWFFALPPLFAIWVNCHGSFSLGIAIAAAILFSSWFRFRYGSLIAIPWDSGRRQTLAWALALSLLALLLNPAGIKLILYPLDTLLHQPIGVSQVSEWQPLQFDDARAFALLGVITCVFLMVVVRRMELYWHELLILVLVTWMAASHRRLLFPFGILTAPILSRLLTSPADAYNSKRDHPLPNAVLIALSLLVAYFAFPSPENLLAQVEIKSPVKAVEFIRTHHPPGPMLNEWIDGGYLVWALPEYPDFIDGRADVFEWSGVMADFGQWATLQAPPTALLDKYHVNFCLLTRGSPMSYVLPLLPNWKSVYSDANSVIFERIPPDGPAN